MTECKKKKKKKKKKTRKRGEEKEKEKEAGQDTNDYYYGSGRVIFVALVDTVWLLCCYCVHCF